MTEDAKLEIVEETEKSRRRRGRRHRHPGRSKALPEIFFCGDPHGEFSQINEAAREYKPAGMVLLGDLQPPAALEEVLEEALAYTDVWWIPGNHDTDSDEFYDSLWRSGLAGHNLHGRVARIGGLRIAGLGGVFRGQIWMPEGNPNYYCPATFIRRVGPGNVWRGGLPRRHRSTIFPSVYQNLLRQHADILVTHEAPGCHKKGFGAIDRLGKGLGVRWLFHGHQHEDRVYGTHQGMTVRAVGYRGIVNLKGEVVVPAQMDPREAAALQSAIDWVSRGLEVPEEPVYVRDPRTGVLVVEGMAPVVPRELVLAARDAGASASVADVIACRAALALKGLTGSQVKDLLAFTGPKNETPEEHEAALRQAVLRKTPGGRWKPWRRGKDIKPRSERAAGEVQKPAEEGRPARRRRPRRSKKSEE